MRKNFENVMEFVTTLGWLEPLLPDPVPPELLDRADALRRHTVRLDTLLPRPTAIRLGRLLRITNSFYSNLIEGQYTEPLELAANAPRRDRKQLTKLAYTHMDAQTALERLLDRYPRDLDWPGLFSPAFVERVHARLFKDATPAELALEDGSLMTPGVLRSRNVKVGRHTPPDHGIIRPMLERMQQVYGRQRDPRQRLLAALAYHHRLSWVHPFTDGNGRTVRMLTHLQLYRLGYSSTLWSLSRGLARSQNTYYERLETADQPRRGDLDGRGQLTRAGLFEFLEFMLDTCLDQVQYISDALATATLRDRLEQSILSQPEWRNAGVRPEAARALHILLTQGSVNRADFKIYLGLGERLATQQLSLLTRLGLVESPTPKSREIYPGLPAAFAQQLFPDLHRRLG